MDINTELKELINKNLPAAVGETLRERLAQANQLEETVDRLNKQLSTANQVIKDQKERLAAHDDLDGYRAELTKIAKDLEQRELKLDLTLAQARAANAESNKADLFALVGLVFKAPEIRRTVSQHTSSNGSEPAPGSCYGTVQVNSSETKNVTEIVSEG